MEGGEIVKKIYKYLLLGIIFIVAILVLQTKSFADDYTSNIN